MTMRYEAPRKFFMLEKNMELPHGFEILAKGEHVAYGEHKNSVDARRALMSYARECGANALLDVQTNHCYVTFGYYECLGIPAVIGKRNPDGRFTRGELTRNFYAPEQAPSTMQRLAKQDMLRAYRARHIRQFMYLLTFFVLCWIAFDQWRDVPLTVSFDYFEKYF